MNHADVQFDLLCDDAGKPGIVTESVKYIGSKLRLIPKILELSATLRPKSVLDGFSGSTRVSQAFAQMGCNVIASDVSVWSEILAHCYLLSDSKKDYQNLINELNACSEKDGWFTHHYGGLAGAPAANGEKKPWQVHNTRKLDGIRDKIDEMSLEPDEKSVALTSLILSLDKVDNTIGHFSSYLKDWAPRSYGKLFLQVPRIVASQGEHKVRRGDIFSVLKDVEVDLAYFDPPYGSNNEKMPPSRVRYAAYYHLWTTICLNDRPELFGKVKRRTDSRDTVAGSVFEDFRKNSSGRFRAVEAVENLIKRANAKYVMLSYSSGGRATEEDLSKALHSCGTLVDVLEMEYKKNVMSGMRWTHEWARAPENRNVEYLFLIRKHGREI